MFTDKDIHFVWIGSELSLLEQLTIKTFQRQGMNPILWTFDSIKNVPGGTIIKDAGEILSRDTLFTYRNEGNGSSVSHWTDRFQLKLLQKYGGWYAQLDVACLRMPQPVEYYFVPHGGPGVDVCVMRTPKDAPFIEPCLKLLEATINADSAMAYGWEDSMRLIGDHIKANNLEKYFISRTHENGYVAFMQSQQVPNSNVDFIHWWNASCGDKKHNPMEGSFYHKLLTQEELI